MNINIIEDIRTYLESLEDTEYKSFNAKLMPTVNPDTIIGIRTPVLRKYAGEIAAHPGIGEFLADLPHQYYEENNLHGFILERIKDYDECVNAVCRFLPYIDNWATCDLMRPKVFKKHKEELINKIKDWIRSDKTYTIRFGIEMLMVYYLDDDFKPEYAEIAAGVISGEYYVNMMIAWYFATALAKQYDVAIRFIEDGKLESWTHNKTIQKAIESRRISEDVKAYLRTLKIYS